MLAGLGSPSSALPQSFGPQGGSHLEALLAQYGSRLPQPQQTATAITDLNDFISGLSGDDRKAIEKDERYLRAKVGLIENFLTYAISATQDGYNFVTGPGRKLAQDLLENAKRAHEHAENTAKDEFAEMQSIIKQQQEVLEAQKLEMANYRSELETLKSSLGE